MNLALSTYTGTGTYRNPFRPRIEGASIDLRPDCTKRDGFALVNTEERVWRRKLGEGFKDTFGSRIRNRVHDLLGVDVSRVKRFDVLAAKLLLEPNGWGALRPTPERYEIWLGGLVWEFPLIRGGASGSDNFNRANEAPLSVAGSWRRATFSAVGSNVDLVSNEIHSASDGDKFYYWNGGAVSVSQYSQTRQVTASTGDYGPIVRLSQNGGGGADCYHFNGAVPCYAKFINGVFSNIGGGPAITGGDLIRIEISGSTLSGFKNGVAMSVPSVTDTSISTSTLGVGFFMFGSSAPGDNLDDWAGGDLASTPQVLSMQPHISGHSVW